VDITKSEWYEWKHDKITQALLELLKVNRQGKLEEWADGKCGSDYDAHITMGQCQGIQDVLNLILIDLGNYCIGDDDA
jgi:hypothetical protein